jgi:hypothetical protein
MNKRLHLNWKKRHPSHTSNVSSAVRENAERIPLWQAIAMPIVSILVFSLLLEGAPALFGVKPVFIAEDPVL